MGMGSVKEVDESLAHHCVLIGQMGWEQWHWHKNRCGNGTRTVHSFLIIPSGKVIRNESDGQ